MSQHTNPLSASEPWNLVADGYAVKRNFERFPEGFMFQQNPDDFAYLKSRFVTSSCGGIRSAPSGKWWSAPDCSRGLSVLDCSGTSEIMRLGFAELFE
jgi:hypothetical protein